MERVNCNRSLNRVIIINSSRERERMFFFLLLSARDYSEAPHGVTPSELMTGKICAGTVVFSRPDILSSRRFPRSAINSTGLSTISTRGRRIPRWNNKALRRTKDSREGKEGEEGLLEIYGLPRNEGDSSASVMAALSPSALLCSSQTSRRSERGRSI